MIVYPEPDSSHAPETRYPLPEFPEGIITQVKYNGWLRTKAWGLLRSGQQRLYKTIFPLMNSSESAEPWSSTAPLPKSAEYLVHTALLYMGKQYYYYERDPVSI